jgi:hypothetical protein
MDTYDDHQASARVWRLQISENVTATYGGSRLLQDCICLQPACWITVLPNKDCMSTKTKATCYNLKYRACIIFSLIPPNLEPAFVSAKNTYVCLCTRSNGQNDAERANVNNDKKENVLLTQASNSEVGERALHLR